MKKYIISSVLMIAAGVAFAQPHHNYGHNKPAFSPEIREVYNVEVRKEARNFYRITQGLNGAYGQTVYVRTDACRIRHGSGSIRLNIDKFRPGNETGSLRIHGVQCRVLDVEGLHPDRPNHRHHRPR